MASFGSVSIANAATTSTALQIPNDCAVVSIQTPAALTGTTLSIQGSQDGSTFGDIWIDGIAFSITVTTSKVYQISPRTTIGLKAIKLVSGSAEGADRTILLTTMKVA